MVTLLFLHILLTMKILRSMRHTLASTIRGLIATRVIYEDVDLRLPPTNATALKREVDSLLEPPLDVLLDRPAGESLLFYMHCLAALKASWLKSRSAFNSTTRTQQGDFSAFDNEAAEGLQSALDHIELPETVWRRIQAAMPILPPSRHPSIQCQPPQLSLAALTLPQSSAGPQQKSYFCELGAY